MSNPAIVDLKARIGSATPDGIDRHIPVFCSPHRGGPDDDGR